MRWVGHTACIDVIRKVPTVLVREPEEKGQLGRHRLYGKGVGLVLGLAAACCGHGSGSASFIKHSTVHGTGDDSC